MWFVRSLEFANIFIVARVTAALRADRVSFILSGGGVCCASTLTLAWGLLEDGRLGSDFDDSNVFSEAKKRRMYLRHYSANYSVAKFRFK